MPRPTRLLLAAGAALVLGAAPASAQSAQPAGVLPFRAGQWGTEFGASVNFPSVGFLRFRSDRSAWLVDVSVDYFSFVDEVETPVSPDPFEADFTRYDVTIAGGLRQYRPVVERVAAFTTFGALVGSFGQVEDVDEQPNDETNGWQAGAFGELGGAWMVTRNLSLGASVQSSFVYFRNVNEVEGEGKATRKGFAFNGGETRLLVTLYF